MAKQRRVLKKRYRILITGSRDWRNGELIREVLTEKFRLHPTAVLVSGGQKSRDSRTGRYYGADYLCEAVWEGLGGEVERHRPDWKRYNKRAGFIRNAFMVSLGANECIAFILNNSPGATFTANEAQKAGIPTERYRRRV